MIDITEDNTYVAYEGHELFDVAESEKNLMRAILRVAMEDISKSGAKSREAKRYFLANDNAYLYSFLNVCRHLELCPKTIRKVLGVYTTASKNTLAA